MQYDFKAIADEFKPLGKYLVKKEDDSGFSVDWKNEDAIRCLTQAIMIVSFKLRSYELPKGYLVPRVPQREAYLDWINKLFEMTDDKVISGFDIGVGANCIYLILAQLKYGWKMCGSEVSKDSIEWAENQIIKPNPLLFDKIKVRL